MNTENEFQLTLPSNASITFSPDNKPANYRNYTSLTHFIRRRLGSCSN